MSDGSGVTMKELKEDIGRLKLRMDLQNVQLIESELTALLEEKLQELRKDLEDSNDFSRSYIGGKKEGFFQANEFVKQHFKKVIANAR